jgi:hypothetical protein
MSAVGLGVLPALAISLEEADVELTIGAWVRTGTKPLAGWRLNWVGVSSGGGAILGSATTPYCDTDTVSVAEGGDGSGVEFVRGTRRERSIGRSGVVASSRKTSGDSSSSIVMAEFSKVGGV